MTFSVIEIEKFIQYNLNERLDGKRRIKGTFRILPQGKYDDFEEEFDCYRIVGKNAKESYECTIKYFNYTLKKHEKKE